MANSKFAFLAGAKGYSGQDVCDQMNAEGFRVHINQFRLAVRDDRKLTEGEERIRATAYETLERMPCRTDARGDFVRRVRSRSMTVKEVWRYYNTTRPHKYAYDVFRRAVARPQSAYEAAIVAEAEKCLAELSAMKAGEGGR